MRGSRSAGIRALLGLLAFSWLLALAPAVAADPRAVLDLDQAADAQPSSGLGWLAPRQVGAAKAAIALCATALLGIGLLVDRPGRRGPAARARDVALALLALAGLASWWNFFQFHYLGFAHASETFHYYLGAKFFPELRYTRLYECVAIADAQAGIAPASFRDLGGNQLIRPDALLADPERCTRHFSAERWSAFRHDVDFLRTLVPPRRWQMFQQDHGYNATPAWGLLGHALTRAAPVSQAQLRLLWALDPLLLAGLWGAAVWGFGWRPAAVAAIYWGTNPLSPYGWTGGALLRFDWLAASVAGIALLRRGRPATSGFLLAWATALRIFPGCLIAGAALGAAWRMLRSRRIALASSERRFAAGTLLGLALAFGASAAAFGGPGVWVEFSERSRVQLTTPLANHVGLATLLSYDPQMRSALARDATLPDPMQRWKEARRARFEERSLLFAALLVGFTGLLAVAAGRAPLWVGAALGACLVPVALELTGYYWSLLLVIGFLAARHPILAPALCGFAAAGWGVSELWHWTDQIHVVWSALGVVLAIACCGVVAAQSARVVAARSARVTPE
jgi:hypothetical protein